MLDNLEQAAAEAASLVADVLEVPGVQILATSRVPLHLRHELVYQVQTLASTGISSPAVDLLHHLAQSQERSALVRLAEASDGVPLLLELVALQRCDGGLLGT